MKLTSKIILLQLYRLAVLVVIVVLIRNHRVLLQIESESPVTLDEIRPLYQGAAKLKLDADRMGFTVLDARGNSLGYVVKTMPFCRKILGYAGPSDSLIVFDPQSKIIATQLRKSPDTHVHIQDVIHDRYFLKTWNGKSWDEVADPDFIAREGIEGVSGATLTSMAIARSITYRLRHTDKELQPPPMLFTPADAGVIAMLAGAFVIAFTRLRGLTWLRRTWQLALIVYLGFISGSLIAQSLLSGWAVNGIAWRSAPGLALLVAAALLVPWTTRRALYCQYLCPHGAVQELIHSVTPKFLRIRLRPGFSARLRWLPPLLILLTLAVTMLVLPLDLADIEPFDAYLIRTAGEATLVIALIGLIASIFIPMAYCKFGCPTGALLEFTRSLGARDRFGKRDWIAALLVLAVAAMSWKYEAISAWIAGLN